MNTTIRQVLVIGAVWPEPRSSAAGANMLALLKRFLAEGWAITFACAAQPAAIRADLAALGVREQRIALNCSSFDGWITALQPDMVVFDRFMTEEQFGWRVEQCCPQALRVLDTEDLHSLRAVRQQLLKNALDVAVDPLSMPVPAGSLESLARQLATSDLAQREVAAIYRCDLSLLLSDVEMALLSDGLAVPAQLLHHAPFMLDSNSVIPAPAFASRRDFVCIGNFLHAPNWDAVLWLKQAIWPMIRARLPQASLFIYGAYTPLKAQALHKPAEGFHVMGWADDALAVLAQARVCLAPLRFGAGIKGKLAEAMLCGTPSVTTSIGVEGMQGDLPWAGIVADDALALANAAVTLHEEPLVWQQAQHNGCAILQQRFDGERIGAALVSRLRQCKAGLQEQRQANFTGALLRHHQHKSTMYMARWIEEKNRHLTPPRESTE